MTPSSLSQRLTLPQLQAWEQLGFGMFIHFGMSTYDGNELSDGQTPLQNYQPTALDVRQWVAVARDAGMKYVVLTTKHVAGFCLWPSRHTQYTVAQTDYQEDVVESFVEACHEMGVLPGLYYCSWDNHNRFGSLTTSDLYSFSSDEMAQVERSELVLQAYVTPEYEDFQMRQTEELLTQYGALAEIWIDIPRVLTRAYRNRLYGYIAEKQPESVIVMNDGITDGSVLRCHWAWPTDVVTIERHLPPSLGGHHKERIIQNKAYYLPAEVCDVVGSHWFHHPDDRPRSDQELLGMYLVARARGANFLLNVGPTPQGVIAKPFADAVLRLGKNIENLRAADLAA